MQANLMQTTPPKAVATPKNDTLAQAHALLVKQTQHAMMNHQDSSMWGICEGVLENASPRTAQQAVCCGDEPAAQVLAQYITYLESLL